MNENKTVQIIPADGWYAKYDMSGIDKGELIDYSKLVCWELVENGAIHGIDADSNGLLERADETANFLGYEYEPKPTIHSVIKLNHKPKGNKL